MCVSCGTCPDSDDGMFYARRLRAETQAADSCDAPPTPERVVPACPASSRGLAPAPAPEPQV
eukprot:3915960-Pyramimonas_sp.AAC.1